MESFLIKPQMLNPGAFREMAISHDEWGNLEHNELGIAYYRTGRGDKDWFKYFIVINETYPIKVIPATFGKPSRYRFVRRGIEIVAVTDTDGGSTTVFETRRLIMDKAGIKFAMKCARDDIAHNRNFGRQDPFILNSLPPKISAGDGSW